MSFGPATVAIRVRPAGGDHRDVDLFQRRRVSRVHADDHRAVDVLAAQVPDDR